MLKIRHAIMALGMLLSPAAPADVQVGVGIGYPNVSIGINLPSYPRLVAVPGYPVYYAPYLNINFFFYDGMYWVFHNDNWYASYWYNGPWWFVWPDVMPTYLLSVPVRYYRQPPPYFRDWQRDEAPRWGNQWGREWERQSGWDQKSHRTAPPPPRAPLPSYQKRYSGERYPEHVERQRELQQEHYRYQPREPVLRQYQEQYRKAPPAPQQSPRQRDQGHGQGRDN